MVTITNLTNYLAEFASFLEMDHKILENTFNKGRPSGKIMKLKANNTDVHNKGKSVFIITFSSGVKIVYKPRSLAPIS